MYVRGGVCNGPSKAGLDSICGHVCTFEPVSVPEADEVGDDKSDADLYIELIDLLRHVSPNRRMTTIEMARLYFAEDSDEVGD